MVYIFFDERYEENYQKFIIPAILVCQDSYSNHFSEESFHDFHSRTQNINFFLEKVNGSAKIEYGIIKPEYYKPKIKVLIKGIGYVPLTNVIWSIVVLMAVTSLVVDATSKRKKFNIIDIYHDPRDLNKKHLKLWHSFIKKKLMELINNKIKEKNLNDGKPISIRFFRSIKKPTKKNRAGKLQRGIWMADQLARDKNLVSGKKLLPKIKVEDISNSLNEVIKKNNFLEYYDS